MTGDFNFGFIEWTNNSSGDCSYKFKKETIKDEKEQFMDLMALCDEYCLLQILEAPTRGENTLDLFLTNEVSLINNLEVNVSNKSDHSKIEISTGYIIDQENKQDSTAAKNDIRNVNFMDDKIDWTTLTDITNKKIENTPCEDESTEKIKQFIKL